MVVYIDSSNEPAKKEKKNHRNETQSSGAMPNSKSRYKICITAVYTSNEKREHQKENVIPFTTMQKMFPMRDLLRLNCTQHSQSWTRAEGAEEDQ